MQCTSPPLKRVQSVETRNLKKSKILEVSTASRGQGWKQQPKTLNSSTGRWGQIHRYREPTGRDDTIRGQPLPPPCLPSPRAASRQGLGKGRSPHRAVQEGSGQVHLGPATLSGEAVPALLAAVFKQRGQTVSKQPARCLQTPHTFQKAWACPSVCGWEGAQEPESS